MCLLIGGAVRTWLAGQWAQTLDFATRAEFILREQCTGVAWELTTAHVFLISSLAWLGRWDEHAQRLPRLLQEAREKGDLYAETTLPLLTYSHVTALAADEPERAREQICQAIQRWTPRGFHLQHLWAWYGEVETRLYDGCGWDAWNLVVQTWPRAEQSYLLRIQTIRFLVTYLRGRSALAAASELAGQCRSDPRIRFLGKEAERAARKIEAERMSWAAPLAKALRTGLALGKGQEGQTCSLLAKAEEGFQKADMSLFLACCRWRRGKLLEGRERDDLVRNAEVWMSGQNIRNPGRMTRMLIPAW